MMDILKRIDQAQQFCKFYADGAYSVETAQWNHHVNPEFIEDIRQYIESLQLKLMHLQTQQAEPTCPECKAAVLYECVACSSNNYPPQLQAEPVAWQPIETAPKDGNAILVMRDIWPGTKSGRAEECNGHNTYVAAWWGDENNGRGAWVCYMDSVCEPQCPIEPTHWMPLPCPPSIAPPQQQAEPPTPEESCLWARNGNEPCPHAKQPRAVAPKCGAIIEVFDKDWRLEYLSLPVGKHKLYTQQYTYTTPPPQRKRPTAKQINVAIDAWFENENKSHEERMSAALKAAHDIKEQP